MNETFYVEMNKNSGFLVSETAKDKIDEFKMTINHLKKVYSLSGLENKEDHEVIWDEHQQILYIFRYLNRNQAFILKDIKHINVFNGKQFRLLKAESKPQEMNRIYLKDYNQGYKVFINQTCLSQIKKNAIDINDILLVPFLLQKGNYLEIVDRRSKFFIEYETNGKKVNITDLILPTTSLNVIAPIRSKH